MTFYELFAVFIISTSIGYFLGWRYEHKHTGRVISEELNRVKKGAAVGIEQNFDFNSGAEYMARRVAGILAMPVDTE